MMNTRRFFLNDQHHLWLTVLRNIWLVTIILSSCGHVPTTPSAVPTITPTETPSATVTPVENIEVRITGKYLDTDEKIICPPICVQTEKTADHSDKVSPLTFNICSQATQECIQVTSGDTVTVPG